MQNFKELVRGKIMDYMPSEYEACEPLVQKVEKNNLSLTGLTIPNGKICPTVYLEHFFEIYKETGDLEGICKEIATLLTKNVPENIQDFDFSWNTIKTKLFVAFTSSLNGNYTETLVKKPFADMYITVKAKVSIAGGTGTVDVRENHVEIWKKEFPELTPEVLIAYALVNTPNVQDALIMQLEEMIDEEIPDEEIPRELLRDMYVVTNKDYIYGAGMILLEEVRESALGKIGTESAIMIPSSMHEVILLPEIEGMDASYVKEMVAAVNNTELEENDILSYEVYRVTKEDITPIR